MNEMRKQTQKKKIYKKLCIAVTIYVCTLIAHTFRYTRKLEENSKCNALHKCYDYILLLQFSYYQHNAFT